MASNRDTHSEQTPLVSPVSIPDELEILKNIDESNPTKIKKTSLPYNPILTPEKKHEEKIDEDDVTPMKIKKSSLLYTPMAISTPEKKRDEKKQDEKTDEDEVTPTKRKKNLDYIKDHINQKHTEFDTELKVGLYHVSVGETCEAKTSLEKLRRKIKASTYKCNMLLERSQLDVVASEQKINSLNTRGLFLHRENISLREQIASQSVMINEIFPDSIDGEVELSLTVHDEIPKLD